MVLYLDMDLERLCTKGKAVLLIPGASPPPPIPHLLRHPTSFRIVPLTLKNGFSNARGRKALLYGLVELLWMHLEHFQNSQRVWELLTERVL